MNNSKLLPPTHTFGLSADGRYIAFSATGQGGCDLYLLDLTTSTVKQLTNSPNYERYPAFSPNGQSIVYDSIVDMTHSYIFQCTKNGEQVTRLTDDNTVYDMRPSFSRDGKQIAFTRAFRNRPNQWGTRRVWDNSDVCIMDSDGSNIKRLTHQNYYNVYGMRFSPDGDVVYYSAPRRLPPGKTEKAPELFTVSTSGNEPQKPLCPSPADSNASSCTGTSFDTSPDGTHIVITSSLQTRMPPNPLPAGLYHLSVLHGNPVPISPKQLSAAYDPAFMPDSKTVVFLHFSKTAGHELWQMDINGKNIKRIADRKLFDQPLQWKNSYNSIQPD